MTHYDLTAYLLKRDKYNWIIKTDKGVVLLDFKESSPLDAEAKARHFLSSWTSVNLIVNYEKD